MASSCLHDQAYHAGFSHLLLYDVSFSHFPSVQLIYLVHYRISLLLLLSLLLLQVLLLSLYHHNLLVYDYRSYLMEIPLANLITHHSYNPEREKSNSWSYFRSKNGNSGDILRSCSSLVLGSEQKGWETALPNS